MQVRDAFDAVLDHLEALYEDRPVPVLATRSLLGSDARWWPRHWMASFLAMCMRDETGHLDRRDEVAVASNDPWGASISCLLWAIDAPASGERVTIAAPTDPASIGAALLCVASGLRPGFVNDGNLGEEDWPLLVRALRRVVNRDLVVVTGPALVVSTPSRRFRAADEAWFADDGPGTDSLEAIARELGCAAAIGEDRAVVRTWERPLWEW